MVSKRIYYVSTYNSIYFCGGKYVGIHKKTTLIMIFMKRTRQKVWLGVFGFDLDAFLI